MSLQRCPLRFSLFLPHLLWILLSSVPSNSLVASERFPVLKPLPTKTERLAAFNADYKLPWSNCCTASHLATEPGNLQVANKIDCSSIWLPGEEWRSSAGAQWLKNQTLREPSLISRSISNSKTPKSGRQDISASWTMIPRQGAGAKGDGFNLCHVPVRVTLPDCLRLCEQAGPICAGVEVARVYNATLSGSNYYDYLGSDYFDKREPRMDYRVRDGPLSKTATASSEHGSEDEDDPFFLAYTSQCLLNTCTPDCGETDGTEYGEDFYSKRRWSPMGKDQRRGIYEKGKEV